MTAAMRAVGAGAGAVTVEAAPRIPRIAVVRGGRILDEILIRDGTPVTIGTSEDALIVARDAPALPASFELIERVGPRYWLRFTADMTGTIAGPDGIVTLEAARAKAHAAGGGAYRIPLAEDARGKIVVGGTTLLFQIVRRPPAVARPQLPLSVRSAVGLDWNLTILVAFSFLLHFGIAGAMYSDWLDPVVATDRTVAGIVDDLARLPRLAPEPAPLPEPPRDDSQAGDTPVPRADADPSPSTATHRSPDKPTPRPSPSVSDDQAAALAAEADRLTVDLLASRSNGPSVQQALDRSNLPAIDLNRAAERNIGVTHEAPDGLKVATGGPLAANPNQAGLPGLAGKTHRTGDTTAGPETAGSGPTLHVDASPAPGGSGAISDADRVIAKLRPRFRKCYQDGLAKDPSMNGKAVLVAKIAPNGEVTSADVGSNDGLSAGVTSCLTRVLGNAQFTGNGSVSTLRVPVSLIHQ